MSRRMQRRSFLREYVLVAQDQPHVERFVLQPNDQWLLNIYDGIDAVIELTDLGCRLALADIYEGVTFGEEESGDESSE